jgi:protein arginine kinase activator
MKTCQACGHRPAVVEFIQVTGNERREMALCRECALSVGMRAQVEAFQRLSQLLIGQQSPMAAIPDDIRAAMHVKCNGCGMLFEEFVQTGLLGCPQCYHDFHEYLQPVLRRMHGVIKQTVEGEEPRKMPLHETGHHVEEPETAAMTREHLEMELNLALLEEDYERAAAIRDRLKKP